METKQFNKLLTEIQAHQKETLSVKSKEYAQNDDRLHNFKEGAKLALTTPGVYLWMLATKHLECARNLAYGLLPNEKELVREKLGDARNYLLLLEALLDEQRPDKKNS